MLNVYADFVKVNLPSKYILEGQLGLPPFTLRTRFRVDQFTKTWGCFRFLCKQTKPHTLLYFGDKRKCIERSRTSVLRLQLYTNWNVLGLHKLNHCFQTTKIAKQILFNTWYCVAPSSQGMMHASIPHCKPNYFPF